MKQLVVTSRDRVGLLADVSEVLAANKVNVSSVSVETCDGLAVIRLIVGEPLEVKLMLEKAGFTVGHQEVVSIQVPNTPGQIAEVSRQLARDGVSIENMFVLEQNRDSTSFVIRVAVA